MGGLVLDVFVVYLIRVVSRAWKQRGTSGWERREASVASISSPLLGKPQRAPAASSDDFMLCPYQILGIGDEKVRVSGGVDAIQALQLAMEMIGAELHFKLNRQQGGKLRLDAGKGKDLGFPVPPSLEENV